MSSPESWLKSWPHRCALLRHARHVGGGVLHAGDVLQLKQPLHGVDRHVDDRAARNVVDDDRDADGVVDRLVVLVQPFLRRLVVIGRDDQHRVGAGLLGVLARDRPPRRSNSSRRRRPPARGPSAWSTHHSTTCLCSSCDERRALAGGADRHEAVGALGDLPVDEVAERLFVEPPFLNGVTSAVKEPRKLVLAAMAALPGERCPNQYRFGGRVESPCRDGPIIGVVAPALLLPASGSGLWDRHLGYLSSTSLA